MLKIRTKRKFLVEMGDTNETVEVDAEVAPDDGRFVLVKMPDTTYRCWEFELIKASGRERSELRKRRLLKD